MLKKIGSIGVVFLLSKSLARRHLDYPEDDLFSQLFPEDSVNQETNNALGTVKSPLVKAVACPNMCLFKDKVGNQLCWNLQSPILQAGW